jgi:hypothetical protein
MKFEDQLFADLMREHGSTLAHTRVPAPRRHVAARRTLLVTGTGVAVAAAATAGVLAAGGGAATPAYALTKNPNGTITLDVYQKSGIAGINAKLHQDGDSNVVVLPVGAGCPSLGSLPLPAVSAQGAKITVGTAVSKSGSITVNAQGIPAGDILVVAIQTTVSGSTVTTGGAARLTSASASLPSCVSLPAPPPPGGGGTGGVTTGGSGGPGTVTTHNGGGNGGSGPAVHSGSNG